jgi:hypothetical protein
MSKKQKEAIYCQSNVSVSRLPVSFPITFTANGISSLGPVPPGFTGDRQSASLDPVRPSTPPLERARD